MNECVYTLFQSSSAFSQFQYSLLELLLWPLTLYHRLKQIKCLCSLRLRHLMRGSLDQYEWHSWVQLDKSCVLVVYHPWGTVLVEINTIGRFIRVSVCAGFLWCLYRVRHHPSPRCTAQCGTCRFHLVIESFGKSIRSGRLCSLRSVYGSILGKKHTQGPSQVIPSYPWYSLTWALKYSNIPSKYMHGAPLKSFSYWNCPFFAIFFKMLPWLWNFLLSSFFAINESL